MRRFLTVTVVTIGLSACVSAPRGPAGTLADAGSKATGAFGTDVRSMSTQLEYADVTESFAATWNQCQNPDPAICRQVLPSGKNYEERMALSNVIRLRANALDQLGQAYAALKMEADYDARADLSGSVNDAISGVNAFASVAVKAATAVPAAGPAAALIGQPLAKVASFGAGLFAEQRQRNRLRAASVAIRAATTRLRDALKVESYVYDDLAGYLQGKRFDARRTLLAAGLISSADLITPMATQLDVKLVGGADAIISKSPASQMAVLASLEAMSRADVERVRGRYSASIAALDALIAGHIDLEKDRPVSLDDVARFLTELDAALVPQVKK